MTKIISRLAMLSSLLFIPFFSIAQESEVEKFCRFISIASDNESCIDTKIDYSNAENFSFRYLEAMGQCDLTKIPPDLQTIVINSENPDIVAVSSAAAICVTKLSWKQCAGQFNGKAFVGLDCNRQYMETVTCQRDLFYRTKEELCEGR